MNAAYIVAGFVSSGNRLLSAIMVRSGCAGEGSTNQPSREQIPPPTRPLVIIEHYDVQGWIRALRHAGYSPVVVCVLVREPIANIRSAITRGHYSQEQVDQAYADRSRRIADNLLHAFLEGIIPEVLTYEGLTEPFLAAWLPRIGLPYVPGEIILPGQIAPPRIELQNEKWYPR